MATVFVPDISLELRALQNPEPILRLAEGASEWRGGETVRVLAGGETEFVLRQPGDAQRFTA